MKRHLMNHLKILFLSSIFLCSYSMDVYGQTGQIYEVTGSLYKRLLDSSDIQKIHDRVIFFKSDSLRGYVNLADVRSLYLKTSKTDTGEGKKQRQRKVTNLVLKELGQQLGLHYDSTLVVLIEHCQVWFYNKKSKRLVRELLIETYHQHSSDLSSGMNGKKVKLNNQVIVDARDSAR